MVTKLIDKLIFKASFILEESDKVLCFIQDNSSIKIPIQNIKYEKYVKKEDIYLIEKYIEDIDSYKEKKTIFLNELIHFLNDKKEDERFSELLQFFEEFQEKCNISFEYYLSNFSFNKIKIELDNSALEYSKNIRSVINESQSKLIAIPVAFILGCSQINYSVPISIKNAIVIISSFLFSYIISIFIKNQQSALDIIGDNIENYKDRYKKSKIRELERKELEKLPKLINQLYKKIEIELATQNKKLNFLQKCNWLISIILLCSILLAILVNYQSVLFKIIQYYFYNFVIP